MFNIALKSSAGSGKTYELAKRFLSLYLRDVPLESLYGITFTNKATLEMKERIINYLNVLVNDNPIKPDEIEIQKIFRDRQKFIKEKRKNLFDNLTSLNIDTFHSLFASFLSTLPFEAGILPGYDIINETEENIIIDEVLDGFFEKALKMEDYRKAIFDLVRNDERRIKESILSIFKNVRSNIRLIRDNIDEIEVIKREIKEKEAQFRRVIDEFMIFMNENAECAYTAKGKMDKYMDNFIQKLQLFINEDSWKEVGELWIKGNPLSKTYFKKFVDRLRDKEKRFYMIVDKLRMSLNLLCVTLSDWELFVHIRPILEIEKMLQAEKLSRNLITFDDIERFAEKALMGGTDYLYFKIGATIDHLMIDEFQDTSIRQWEVLKPLVDEITSYGAGEKTLFYVGDPNQAVFRWRGGEAKLFDFVKKEYEGKIVEETLKVNHRSKSAIVEFVNRLFKRNDIYEKNNKGGWISFESVGDYSINEGREESRRRTVEIIKGLIEEGYKYDDIAILVRENKFGIAMTDLLDSEGIPCISESKANLFSREDTKTIINLLKFLECPEDDFSLSCVLLSPSFGLKENTLRRIKDKGKGKKSLYLSLVDEHPDWDVSKKLNKLLSIVGFSTPYEIVYKICKELEFTISGSIAALLQAALLYTHDGFNPLSSFIDWVELIGESIAVQDIEGEGIRILTIHKAKGLEFPVVIIPDTVWGLKEEDRLLLYYYEEGSIEPDKVYWARMGSLFPEIKEASIKRVIEDEKKVLYVALTRAVNGLYILGFDWQNRKSIFTWFDFIKGNVECPYYVGKVEEGREEMANGKWQKAKEKGEEGREEMANGKWQKAKVMGEGGRKEMANGKWQKANGKGVRSIKEERELYSPTERGVEIVTPERQEKIEFGNIVHDTLSRLEWLDGRDINEVISSLLEYAKSIYVRKEEDERLIEEKVREIIYNTLTFPDFQFAFNKGDKDVRLKVEVPVYYEKGKRDVSIKIDRLLIEPSKITIIDYKTGEEKDEDIKQLKEYREGMNLIFPERDIRAYLFYLDKGIVRQVG